MAWVRIDDHAPEHPKLLKVGPTAGWLWVCGLAYCSRHLTDGLIPAEAVPTMGIHKAQDAVARLLAAGLWEETPTGYQVHDYHEYQPSRSQITTRRKREVDRVTEWRKRNGYAHGNATVTPPVTDEKRTGTHPPDPDPDPVPQKPVYTAPLGSRAEHRSHAVCGRACLPAFLFREFVQLRGGPEDAARAEVDAWASALIQAIGEDGPRKAEPIGDPLKWWRAQWDAAHTPTKGDALEAAQARVLAEVMAGPRRTPHDRR